MMSAAAMRALFVSAVFAAAPASASEPDLCERWQIAAMRIMEGRQSGVILGEAARQAIATATTSSTPDEDRALFRFLVLEAYGTPLATTDRLALVAAIEFGERAYAECSAATSSSESD